jgi:hypothetical protein
MAFVTSKYVQLLTFCGWLLMVPPFEGSMDNLRVRRDLPVSQWRQSEAFDSARDCERAKTAVLKALLDGGMKPYDPGYLGWSDARCVPADHLYPPRARAPK